MSEKLLVRSRGNSLPMLVRACSLYGGLNHMIFRFLVLLLDGDSFDNLVYSCARSSTWLFHTVGRLSQILHGFMKDWKGVSLTELAVVF